MCKYCYAIAATMGLLILALVLRFMVVGATESVPDGRTAIIVTAVERDRVLAEMRGFLEAVQTIIVANNAGDLNTVAMAARKVGKANMDQRSSNLAGKLPIEFRRLGMDTHSRFDLLALDAEQFESTEHASQQLGALTGNCVACHRAYRLVTKKRG